MTIFSWMRSALAATCAAAAELAGLVLPVECGGCGAPAIALCAECATELAGPPRPVPVARPAGPAGPAGPERPPARAAPPGNGVAWVVAPYTGRIRRLVVAWKDRGRLDLTGPLARALAVAVTALLEAADPAEETARVNGGPGCPPSGVGRRRRAVIAPVLLVPVPSSRAARRRRGSDVVLQLAREAAGGVRDRGTPVRVVPALQLARTVADQAGLNRAGRARNVAGAMRLRPCAGRVVAGQRCIVVDDVVTTGASAGEATRVLSEAGARPLGLAAVCATPLHRRLSDVAHLH